MGQAATREDRAVLPSCLPLGSDPCAAAPSEERAVRVVPPDAAAAPARRGSGQGPGGGRSPHRTPGDPGHTAAGRDAGAHNPKVARPPDGMHACARTRTCCSGHVTSARHLRFWRCWGTTRTSAMEMPSTRSAETLGRSATSTSIIPGVALRSVPPAALFSARSAVPGPGLL